MGNICDDADYYKNRQKYPNSPTASEAASTASHATHKKQPHISFRSKELESKHIQNNLQPTGSCSENNKKLH